MKNKNTIIADLFPFIDLGNPHARALEEEDQQDQFRIPETEMSLSVPECRIIKERYGNLIISKYSICLVKEYLIKIRLQKKENLK